MSKIQLSSTGPAMAATLALSVLVSAPAMALRQSDVDRMGRECEAARERALTPIREQKTRSCIEQQIRAPDHCERYYKTYGNTSISGGMRSQGAFYDLPECQAYLEARETLTAGRSR